MARWIAVQDDQCRAVRVFNTQADAEIQARAVAQAMMDPDGEWWDDEDMDSQTDNDYINAMRCEEGTQGVALLLDGGDRLNYLVALPRQKGESWGDSDPVVFLTASLSPGAFSPGQVVTAEDAEKLYTV